LPEKYAQSFYCWNRRGITVDSAARGDKKKKEMKKEGGRKLETLRAADSRRSDDQISDFG